jgi:hypothetical protein
LTINNLLLDVQHAGELIDKEEKQQLFANKEEHSKTGHHPPNYRNFTKSLS